MAFLRRTSAISRSRQTSSRFRNPFSTSSMPSDSPILTSEILAPSPDLSPEESALLDNLHSLIADHDRFVATTSTSMPVDDLLLPSLSSSFSLLLSSPPSPSLCYSLIRRLSLLRYPPPFAQTLSFFNWYLSRSPLSSDLPFVAMIDFAAKLQHFEIAWRLLDRLLALNIPVPSAAFHVLIRRYVRAALPDEAAAAFRRMPDYGLSPDAATFSVLIASLSKKRFAAEAQSLFDSFKQQFPPDVVLYTNVVHAWCRAGRLDEAERVFREMRDNSILPNVYTYTSVIEAMCRAGQIPQAQELLCQMIDDGCPPNTATFNSFLRAHVKAGRAEQALQVHNQMKQMKVQPDVITYNFLIEAHCRKGQQNLEAAIKVLNQMVSKGATPNVNSFNAIFRCVRDLGNINAAHTLYSKMRESNCKPNTVTYNLLMGLFNKEESMAMVLKMKREMEEEGVEANVNTYGLLLSACCKRGHWKRAYQLMKEMVEAKCLKPTTPVYKMVLELLKNAGQLKKYEELLEKMAERGFVTRVL